MYRYSWPINITKDNIDINITENLSFDYNIKTFGLQDDLNYVLSNSTRTKQGRRQARKRGA